MDSLKTLPLDLTHYLLFTLIFLFVHLINVIEIVSLNGIGKINSGNKSVRNLKFLTTISMIGVAATIVIGFFAEFVANSAVYDYLILIPVTIFGIWLRYQFGYSSLVDIENVKSRIRSIVKDEIITYADKKEKFTLEELKADYAVVVNFPKVMRQIEDLVPRGTKFAFANITSTFDFLYFHESHIAQIMDELVNDKKLERQYYEGLIYFKPGNLTR